MEEVKSPLTGKTAKFEKEISVTEIIRDYNNNFGIDVGQIFNKTKSIKIYHCTDSDFRFYYPYSVDGDGSFYQKLQTFDWYYMPWKWEHKIASQFIEQGMRLLEVGCAEGEFLLRNKLKIDVKSIGLELNSKAVEKALKKDLMVIMESVQEHSISHTEHYDIVCSFQVLEHISDINSFLEAQIKLLKPNGKLIISVPNNKGFLGLDNGNVLNFPPHHMGLWNESSLRYLTKIFPIKLEHIFFEPPQKYHEKYFLNVVQQYYFSKKPKFIQIILRKFLSYSLFRRVLIAIFPKKIKAFTIQAVYTKRGI